MLFWILVAALAGVLVGSGLKGKGVSSPGGARGGSKSKAGVALLVVAAAAALLVSQSPTGGVPPTSTVKPGGAHATAGEPPDLAEMVRSWWGKFTTQTGATPPSTTHPKKGR
jgi:hypothetical protein